MNKKNLVIIILTLSLIGGLYYITMGRKTNEISPKDTNVIERNKEGDKDKEKSEIEFGEEAPNFTLKNLDGEEVSLKDYRGKIVFINFWATWCKYCDIEMPDLQKFNKENEDVVVLAVDVRENKSIVEKYIKKGKYTFPVVLDEKGDVANTYLVNAFPISYFVDKEGILLGGVRGMMTYPQMNQILENIRKTK